MTIHIHILGGGIGGMSAALHLGRLVEIGALPAGSRIRVYEKSDRLGGKAVSQIVPAHEKPGLWPGEHGFRFFPNFYRCIVDTLEHVPVTEALVERTKLRPELAGKSVAGLLRGTKEGAVALGGKARPIRRAASLDEVPRAVASLLEAFPVTRRDVARFAAEMIRFLLTCNERALVTWENETLSSFLARCRFGPEMETFLRSLRALSAMRADRGSLRTLLFTATQMLADFDDQYALWDAVLPGPTDYLMLDPWEDELRRLGVELCFDHQVVELAFGPAGLGLPSRLERARLRSGAGEVVLDAGPDDYFVLALPYERARPLLLEAPNRPSTLDGVTAIPQSPDNLGMGAEPMVGIQYFLRTDPRIVEGHAVYPEAPWAMTSVSQAQFWLETFRGSLDDVFGTDGMNGVLSVIVSAWDVVAPRLGKAPKECTPEELAREAFAQIQDGVGPALSWADVIHYHVDSDIEFSPGRAHCPTPLWVSPRGSFLDRPLADPGCGNFFLASDWVRTETDVGSMESADEAARLAVQGIIASAELTVPADRVPHVRPLRLWRSVETARAVDRWLFHRGLPHPLHLPGPARRVLVRALRTLRDGLDLRSYLDGLELVHLALGLKAPFASWREVEARGAGRAELDRVIEVLEAVDDSGWTSDGDPAAPIDRVVTELSAIE